MLSTRVMELEARLRGDSSNSSRPPSTDGPVKPVRQRGLKPRSTQVPGGQQGHPGAHLARVTTPDEVVEHRPDRCGACGVQFPATAPVADYQVRQVFELPVIKALVVEHRLVSLRCGCGAICQGAWPYGVDAPAVYGPRAQAAVCYLYQHQFLSRGRSAQTAQDLFGLPVSTGSVVNFQARAAHDLAGFMAQAGDLVKQAPVVGADETGIRVAGKNHWLHVARTDKVTVLGAHRRRGRVAMTDLGILPGFDGVLVSDAFSSYDKMTGDGGRHQLCAAHLRRELQAVTDFHQLHPEYLGEAGWDWAVQADDALMVIIKACAQSPDGCCPPDVLAAQRCLLNSAAVIAASSDHGPPGQIGAKHLALARRIHRRLDDYLRFAVTPGVSPDNNGSERDFRMAKLRMKVSGGLRCDDGAQWFARIRSYLSTCVKNQINGFDALLRVYTGNPWLPQTA